ncbi:MAG: hypothetical protein IT546_17245 [Caulobacteraceae bacterium]|nr:hypothetical protein [Caulobacteraceae bacterium]
MLRLILAVLAGVVVGVIVVGVVEGMGHTIFPPPPGVDLTDPAQLKTAMAQLPVQAKIWVLLAWFLGTLAGASTGNLIAGRRRWAGRAVSMVLFVFAVWTMLTIPHPAWFAAAAVAATLVAATLAEVAFGRPRFSQVS